MDKYIIHNIVKLGILHVTVLLNPGQSFLLVAKHSLAYSKRSGLFVAMGTTVATLIYVTFSLLGLTALIKEIPALYIILKYTGACYLLFLGFKDIFNKSNSISSLNNIEYADQNSLLNSFNSGLFTTLLNPRAALYFLGIFTQVAPQSGYHFISILYGCEVTVLTLMWFSLVAFIFSIPTVIKLFQEHHRFFKRILGSLLVAIGLLILFQ